MVVGYLQSYGVSSLTFFALVATRCRRSEGPTPRSTGGAADEVRLE